MTITEILAQNARQYALEIGLIEREPASGQRREITWLEFNDQANQYANALIARGIVPGDRVAILMMNCLEWLPIYFGILRTGAMAAPLNFRFTAEEIGKCIEAAGAKVLFYGPEFTERIAEIGNQFDCLEKLIFVGDDLPPGAESHLGILASTPVADPGIVIGDHQAKTFINSGMADQEDFSDNATRLEARLASLGLLKRLSDSCAYVENPFQRTVRS